MRISERTPLPLAPSFLTTHTEGLIAFLSKSGVGLPPRLGHSLQGLLYHRLAQPQPALPSPKATSCPYSLPPRWAPPRAAPSPNTAAHLLSPKFIHVPSECFTFPFTPNRKTRWPMDFGIWCQWLKIPVLSVCQMTVGNSFITFMSISSSVEQK